MATAGRIQKRDPGGRRRGALGAFARAAAHLWRDRFVARRIRQRALAGSYDELDFLRRTGAI